MMPRSIRSGPEGRAVKAKKYRSNKDFTKLIRDFHSAYFGFFVISLLIKINVITKASFILYSKLEYMDLYRVWFIGGRSLNLRKGPLRYLWNALAGSLLYCGMSALMPKWMTYNNDKLNTCVIWNFVTFTIYYYLIDDFFRAKYYLSARKVQVASMRYGFYFIVALFVYGITLSIALFLPNQIAPIFLETLPSPVIAFSKSKQFVVENIMISYKATCFLGIISTMIWYTVFVVLNDYRSMKEKKARVQQQETRDYDN